MRNTHRTHGSNKLYWEGKRRYEHWFRDNQVYFITATVKGHAHAFASEEAKRVFWDRFDRYTSEHGFTPWVTSLLINHYHAVGYLRRGADLGPMMQRLHGSTAKLVNDLLPARIAPFWRSESGQDYFDGCIRDERQCHLVYSYTLTQSVRHGLATSRRAHRHTRVDVEVSAGVRRAVELGAFLGGVRYYRRRG